MCDLIVPCGSSIRFLETTNNHTTFMDVVKGGSTTEPLCLIYTSGVTLSQVLKCIRKNGNTCRYVPLPGHQAAEWYEGAAVISCITASPCRTCPSPSLPVNFLILASPRVYKTQTLLPVMDPLKTTSAP